ncbi:MAG TPA: hypothetical protein VGO11_21090 [Chthoniobacteraceae bacterium]|nr:hypothetical protein [Chthoniobacteraceae bacterium]
MIRKRQRKLIEAMQGEHAKVAAPEVFLKIPRPLQVGVEEVNRDIPHGQRRSGDFLDYVRQAVFLAVGQFNAPGDIAQRVSQAPRIAPADEKRRFAQATHREGFRRFRQADRRRGERLIRGRRLAGDPDQDARGIACGQFVDNTPYVSMRGQGTL